MLLSDQHGDQQNIRSQSNRKILSHQEQSQAKGTSLITKLLSEIKIHKSLSHAHIVQFENCFEDSENVYIFLELCTNKSLSEMLKRRKKLTYR
mgnify:CR=1 FL=1